MKSIFEYLDFRQYLIDYYEERKKHGDKFSYKIWADLAGFKAKDFILRVMRGESRISAASATSLAKAMEMSQSEVRYFYDMVRYAQSKTLKERNNFYQRLSREHVRRKASLKAKIVPHDHFEFYAEWYHGAIRSLINSYGFSNDYSWLAKQVYPAISVSKARKSVALLEKLDLIRKDASGAYRVTDTDITTGDEVKKGALLHFYGKGMDLMTSALEKLPMDKRNIFGITMGVSEPTYFKVVEKIKTFRDELAKLACEDTAADRVYHLNFHLFPLSNVSGKNRRST